VSINSEEVQLIKTTGDGALAEFASPLAAMRCAVEIQDHLAAGSSPLRLRVGLNLGDVIVGLDGDLYGDGINIAVRLEGIADPGGILISEKVFSEVEGKLDVGFEDRGEQQLKNISKPVRAYALRAVAYSGLTERLSTAPPLPDKPSIAVLPFQNMSGDAEQEYFADGIVDDIITALSRFRQLFVIARNSSFTYKGGAVDVRQVGRELGVRYVLKGSVRKAGSRVRITAQLIDAATGAHLWADRSDGQLEDIFDLQDRVTAGVVGQLVPKLEQAEIERARAKPTESLDAYDYYLRGMAHAYHYSRDSINEALRLFYRAIELDSRFASAYGMAARCYSQRKASGWTTDRVQEIAETARLARRAGELGQDDAVALCTAGIALAYVVGDLEDAAAFTDRALLLNPNLAWAWLFSGWVRAFLGEPDVAIEHQARAMRLSPLDPTLYNMQTGTALAHLLAGRHDDASSWSVRAFRDEPNYVLAGAVVAAANALSGRLEEARQAMERLRQINPALRISSVNDLYPLRRQEDRAKLVEGLRKAGLPE
jgi:adenylate cyclase